MDVANIDRTPFIADREIVDSLKLDASILTPEQDTYIKSATKTVNESIVDTYGQYIPTGTLQKAKGIEERVLIMNEEAFRAFREWDPEGHKIEYDPSTAASFFPIEGGIMALSGANKIWDVMDIENKKYVIEKLGSEDKAKQYLGLVGLIGSIAHEAIHQYQDNDLPEYFYETGVRWYEKQIVEKLGVPFLQSKAQNAIVDFYDQLIKEYGDDVHSVFFGNKAYDEKYIQILSAFDSQTVERLFPEGKFLHRTK